MPHATLVGCASLSHVDAVRFSHLGAADAGATVHTSATRISDIDVGQSGSAIFVLPPPPATATGGHGPRLHLRLFGPWFFNALLCPTLGRNPRSSSSWELLARETLTRSNPPTRSLRPASHPRTQKTLAEAAQGKIHRRQAWDTSAKPTFLPRSARLEARG